MALIVDVFHKNKLNKFNINIKTNYIVGNNILERNSNGTKNDDIKSGIRCGKEYYVNNELRHTENEFDSRIEYTFVSKDLEKENYKCLNCGMNYKVSDNNLNCPYCGTYYNIDYIDKDLGTKYHYDRVLRSNLYRIITGIVDLGISLLLSFIFLKSTSRTFNIYDISKVFIYGIILSLILYYFFYLIDAYIVLAPIKKYKDKMNKKQAEFWEKSKIDKKNFFNNFNLEIRKYYYNQENIIDYDIIDYLDFEEFKKDNDRYVYVSAEIRVVSFANNKFISKYKKEKFIFKHNGDVKKLNAGPNIIKCANCGTSIDVLKDKCEYCNTEIKYLQEWVLDI